MNRIITALSSLVIAGAFAAASAQDMDVFDPEAYQPYGEVQFGDYEAYEGDENEGAVNVTVTSPDNQAIDIVLVGPNGFDMVEEVQDQETITDLQPGVYAAIATDDGLQVAYRTIEVRVGEAVNLGFNMTAMPETYMGGEDLTTVGAYGDYTVGEYQPIEGYNVENDADAYGQIVINTGAISAMEGETTEGAETAEGEAEEVLGDLRVHVIGPDDQRFNGAIGDVMDNLIPGTYVVAVTGEGYGVSTGVVEVRPGEVAQVNVSPHAMMMGETSN